MIVHADATNLSAVFDYLKKHVGEEEPKILPQVMLVAEELFMNVAMHVPDSANKTVEMGLSTVPEGADVLWRLMVKDYGPPYNPFEQSAAPELDADVLERPIGGLGIHLIRNVAYRQEYERTSDEANLLQIYFRPETSA